MYYNREIKELAQEFSTDLKSGLTEQKSRYDSNLPAFLFVNNNSYDDSDCEG